MLAPMVDAPIFVRIARENNLCAFVAGPPPEEMKIDHESFRRLGALWAILEPYLQAYGKVNTENADGLRVHQEAMTIKHLLREKHHHETLNHFIKFVQRKLGLESLAVEEHHEGGPPRGGKSRGKKGGDSVCPR
jgi:hypothetical protein